MKLFVILLLLILGVPAFGQNNRLPFVAEGSVSLDDDDPSCDLLAPNPAVSYGHQAYVRRCDLTPDVTQGFGWHFYWSPLMPQTGTIDFTWEALAAGTGNVCWQITLGCETAGLLDMAFAAANKASQSYSVLVMTPKNVTLAVPASPADKLCSLRMQRVRADVSCTDNIAAEMWVQGGFLKW